MIFIKNKILNYLFIENAGCPIFRYRLFLVVYETADVHAFIWWIFQLRWKKSFYNFPGLEGFLINYSVWSPIDIVLSANSFIWGNSLIWLIPK